MRNKRNWEVHFGATASLCMMASIIVTALHLAGVVSGLEWPLVLTTAAFLAKNEAYRLAVRP